MSRRYQTVDVFHDQPFSGNPLAVVFDAGDLSTDEMQRITRWLNLSETTFLLPPSTPDADYRVRIFTIDREMPFAGHPTLGTCHAWLVAGGRPKRDGLVIQECAAGLIDIRHQTGQPLAFAAPPLIRSGPVDPETVTKIAHVLQIDPNVIVEAEWADNGPGWILVRLADADAVKALEPLRATPGRLDLGVVGLYPAGGPLAYEVRAFFTAEAGALREDPVTGSLNAAVAQAMIAKGLASAPYVAAQGECLGRTGRIFIDQDAAGRIWVGGRTETLVLGTMTGAKSA
jgi:PhzF family phenazine biosynthesis protein